MWIFTLRTALVKSGHACVPGVVSILHKSRTVGLPARKARRKVAAILDELRIAEKYGYEIYDPLLAASA